MAKAAEPEEKGLAALSQPELPPAFTTPADLLRIAVSRDADIEKLSKLMDLQERWEKNEAKKAFTAAMVAFKSERTEIVKSKKVRYEAKGGSTSYSYAPLDEVCERIVEALSKYDISHRWAVQQPDGRIKVTCVLTHKLGHSEETAIEAKPDTTGSKNEVQAVGSTVTYLERYTLLAATGLAPADADDDGLAGKIENLKTGSAPKPQKQEPAHLPQAGSSEKAPAGDPTGPSNQVPAGAASPEVFSLPPAGATFAARMDALTTFLYGPLPKDSRRENRIHYYALFCAPPAVNVQVERVPGRWDPDLWNAAVKALKDRKERLSLLENFAANSGRESFLSWATEQVSRMFGNLPAEV